MKPENVNELKLIYIDILNGYSEEEFNSNIIYLKHLNIFDSNKIEECKNSFYKKAIKKGLPTKKDKTDYLNKECLWIYKNEEEIKKKENYINSLKRTKTKLFKSNDLDIINNQIQNETIQLNKILGEKNKLIGFIAEDYAIKKSNEYLIYNSLYKDANLKIKNFSEKSFEEIDNEDLYILGDIYKKFVEKFSTLNIKKISLLPFYRNLYNLSNDNPYYLYGKRILDLTFYQIEVFSYARYFKNIISESKNPPPEDYLDDPDKIIEWFDSSKNINELLDNKNSKNADGSSIVGATKEDLKKLGKEENGVSIFEEASKKGGKLSMEDMMKLHGIG